MTSQYARAEDLVDELVAARDRGDSISSMATQHGLRREAITTVLTQRGISDSSPARDAVLLYVREHPGLSVDDLALRLDLSKSSVSRYLRGAPEQRLVVSRKHTDLSKFSEDEMGEALRSAYRSLSAEERNKGLSRVKYMAIMKGVETAPAASTFIRRYGSWTAACERHGITAAKPKRTNYVQEWTNDDILAAVNEFITETGSTVFHAYAEWARQNKKPSGPLLIMRFQSWSNARKEAIQADGQAA
jgi:predicted transcriptional regulator